MKKTLSALVLLLTTMLCLAQTRTITQEEQTEETSPIILNRISQWQDLKFGFFAHWGIYATEQLVESWSICNEPWIDRKGANYEQYKQWYWDLNKKFNPQNFDASSWAKAAKDAGMKYFVFTTKHHDGFCMYDSKYTDYSVAGKDCPYSKNKNNDITAQVVEAFRAENFWTGLYFSKADWHNQDYWSPMWATPDRNVNYDIENHQDMWQRFTDFTTNQIQEITHNYGEIDILWLDAGWIRPQWSLNEETEPWLGAYKRIQDIDMPNIAKIARQGNEDMIIVDRTVGGKYENYRTPEQQVPDKPLDYPWETCMTMGDSWSYVKGDNYKSVNQLLHILVDVVAKGGNFLLNVGPDENGQLPQEALTRMQAIGQWLRVNGQAIYSTRPIAPYKVENVCFTHNKDGKNYALILLDEDNPLQETYHFTFSTKLKTGTKTILGQKTSAKLSCKKDVYTLKISKPKKIKETNVLVIEL